MKVILLKELKGKGGEGDVIDVAPGFANNYLLTQGYAILATKGNLKQLEQRKHNIAKREEKRIADAEALKSQLEGIKVKVDVQVGEEGQLFGSVTTTMIADAIKAATDVEIDKRRIELNRPIKTAGIHDVTISLYREIKTVVKLQAVNLRSSGVKIWCLPPEARQACTGTASIRSLSLEAAESPLKPESGERI